MRLKIEPPPAVQEKGGLSAAQSLFVRSMVQYTLFSGGYGSGKTLACAYKALVLSAMHKKSQGLVCEPTYRMLEDIMIPTFRDDVLEPLGLLKHSTWHASKMKFTMPWGAEVLFRSTERPMKLRGFTLAWFLLDEGSVVQKFGDVWNSLTSRLRCPLASVGRNGDPLYFGGVLGTPEGDYDEIYDTFIRPPDRDRESYEFWRKNFFTVTGTSMDNPGLPESFIRNLEANIIPELRQAHILGRYINVTRGKVYWLDDEKNVVEQPKVDPNIPLRLSWDFNIDPMVCLVWQRVGNDQRGGKHAVIIDEISIKKSNTREVCALIAEKYGGHLRPVIVNGDATGSRGTAEFSDYETIVEHLQPHFYGGVEIAVYDANPPHKRRVHAVNRKMSNGELRIASKCRRLLRDLRYQRWDAAHPKSKDKSQAIDGETLGHASDALDYLVDYYWPYRPSSARQTPKIASSRLHAW